ncbi:class I SAM-dependent methyltransferase [Jannaschia sp. Os4]|uniref:class I SAM-dependent methyltransferase n=1 Tax=Jannaschia sp. Os4 TaxID=2807617 RepID=UPI001EED0BDF|nr:class I SAM-dependent methyltransferase [Jannaschia sp. Os4]
MRLSLALEDGAVALPDEGRVLLLRPPAYADLSALPLDRCVAVQPFRPDHDALAPRMAVTPDWPEGAFAAAVVFLPRAKRLARDLVARACAAVPPGAPVIVDGDKTDGIESLLKDVRRAAEVGGAFSKAHGKTFALAAAPMPSGWTVEAEDADGWTTRAGIFSADGPDPGSVLLADTLPPLKGAVCDLGAGWGYLSARLLEASPAVTACDLVEADADALSCARANVPDPRAAFHWADATAWGGTYDAVVCNPPFHPSRKADPALGRAFIRTIRNVLAPRGRAWVVANRHLPYEAALGEAFAQVDVRAEAKGYKVVELARPKRSRR